MKKIVALLCVVVAGTVSADLISAVGAHYGDGVWFEEASAWSDGQVPHADADYIVDRNNADKNNNAIRFGKAGYDFGGNSLQFGVVGGYSAGMIMATQTVNFPREGLKLGRGYITSWINPGSANSPRVHVIQGKVTVLAETAAPYEFAATKDYHAIVVESNLVGNANAYLVIKSGAALGFRFPLGFDASEYYGTIDVKNGANGTILSVGPRFTMNGHLIVREPGSVIGFDSSAVTGTVKKLTLMTPVTFQLNHAASMGTNIASGVLQVTDEFVYSGTGKMLVKHSNGTPFGWMQGVAGRTYMRFLTVPKSSAVTVDDFEPFFVSTSRQLHPRCDIVELEEAPGTKTFALRRRPYVQFEDTNCQTATDPELGKVFTWSYMNAEEGVPYTDPRAWDVDYFTKSGDGSARYYGTPNSAETYTRVGGYYYFTGKEGGGNAIGVNTKDVDVREVYLEGGCYIANGGGQAANWGVLRGDITLVDYLSQPVYFHTGTGNTDGRKLEIAATLKGSCDVQITTKMGAGSIRISGDNVDYKGGWSTYRDRGEGEFRVSRSTALGGALDAFRADALVITNGFVFIPEGSITLAEPTRGITVKGTAAKLNVENDDRAVLGSTLTFDGTLVKGGAGTLVLSNAVDVSSGNANLTIAAGCVQPVLPNALAGVAVDCGNGGLIKLDLAGIGETGLVDPEIAPGGTFRLTVETDDEMTHELPLCTLDAGKVAAFRSAFRFVRTGELKTTCSLKSVPVAGNRVLLIARIGPSGCCLIIR